jgi:two-component system response regulator PilR (NtrC family)
VIRVEVPPLRDRREDLPELLAHFTERASKEHGKEVRTFSPDARRALDAYAFPGNVRELENIVERAVALAATQLIGLGDLPREVSGAASQPTPGLSVLGDGCNLDDMLGELERRLIVQALERSGGVRTNAAKLLGVTFRSLRYRMEKLGMVQLTDEDEDPASTNDPTSSARIVTPRAGK